MKLIPVDQVEWKPVKIIKEDWRIANSPYRYEFLLPEPLASWDVFDYWEKPRVEHMATEIKSGDILFDVGTEQGWTNLIYATFCDPQNIVLFEPTAEFWPNIKETWEKNYSVAPLACYQGLISDNTTSTDVLPKNEYPECALTGTLIDRNKYQYIHENDGTIAQITIDDYVEQSGIIPDAITMDIEGAELLALKGAVNTLVIHQPKLWISIHDDLAERDYGTKPYEVLQYLVSLGYSHLHLSKDHESHDYFWVE